uniref:Uncharacterized protein n=1 Tax=Anopheles atroparvus TaxID=41427 RepID=A0A182J0F0_ANOAO
MDNSRSTTASGGNGLLAERNPLPPIVHLQLGLSFTTKPPTKPPSRRNININLLPRFSHSAVRTLASFGGTREKPSRNQTPKPARVRGSAGGSKLPALGGRKMEKIDSLARAAKAVRRSRGEREK